MNGLPPIVKERPPEGTRRVLLTVSYDGTAYAGWQWQDNALSVQQVLEEALARLTGEKTRVTGASRTDAGVHALGQRAHFDTASRIPPDKYPFALNTLLPPDIRVLEGFAVPADFHARFDARGKRYTYRIYNAPHASALMRSLTAHVPRPLDMDRMSNSLPALLGTHDFAAFQASGGTARTTVRTLREASLRREGPLITLTVRGNAFLYNMVRIMAGTLLQAAREQLGAAQIAAIVAGKDRSRAGVTAPAHGLCLDQVFYGGMEGTPDGTVDRS